jgi:hypothetical protein
MSWQTLRGHALVLAATIAGIVGFSLIYDAFRYHSMAYVTTGVPLLMIGLWWAGHELGRSNLASKARKSRIAHGHSTSTAKATKSS